MELKATTLLHLRRFTEVADMLQDYIPSLKLSNDDSSSTSLSSSSSLSDKSQSFTRERVKLLPDRSDHSFKYFSVSDLKKRIVNGLGKNRDHEDQWRYLILGQACCHLGLMEDAMALLQAGKRLASAAHRRESICWSDDSFASSSHLFTINQPQTPPRTDTDTICHLLSHIKLLLRRKTAAIAAAEAGLHAESIRHFTKIIDGRRPVPHRFLAECYMHRAEAYQSAGRIPEAITDCNRTLALDPSCIEALTTRSSLYKCINCLTDSLHDLEHLKLLYNSILRDRKLPGPAWKRQRFGYHEIPGKLCSIAAKINKQKKRVAGGEIGTVDYYALMGLTRGCSQAELERAYLLLTLRYNPEKSTSFIDRCEFSDEQDVDSVKDRARMSSLLLYRLIQRGYSKVIKIVLEEDASKPGVTATITSKNVNQIEKKNTFQGVFCRDLAVVGNLLSQTGFNRPIQVKYEGLSC